jgi:hypothetical protein
MRLLLVLYGTVALVALIKPIAAKQKGNVLIFFLYFTLVFRKIKEIK